MSTLKTNQFAPSEGTCYNRSTGKECTTGKNGKYSAKDWKKNVTYGKNDGQKMTQPEKVLIKACLGPYLKGKETDGELIDLADRKNIDINHLRERLHAKEMLKRVERAYSRSGLAMLAMDEDTPVEFETCTYVQLLVKLDSFINGRNIDEDEFKKWIRYAKWLTGAEKTLYKSRTKQLNFDTGEGWHPREGELNGESNDGGGCTIT